MSKKSVKLYTDNVIEHFYEAIRTNNVDKLHIPHSDVFYVRKATGESYSLQRIEAAMIAEGWLQEEDTNGRKN
jgi:hypothetical protein